MKLAGRDGNQVGIVIDVIDDTYVLIDGNVRRKKCNIKHLQPLSKQVEIKKNAPTSEVNKALESEGIEILKKQPKKESKPKPTKKRKIKTPKKEKKPTKKQKK